MKRLKALLAEVEQGYDYKKGDKLYFNPDSLARYKGSISLEFLKQFVGKKVTIVDQIPREHKVIVKLPSGEKAAVREIDLFYSASSKH